MYKGPAPSRVKPLEVDHDMDCCAKKPILPETLLVSEEGKVRERRRVARGRQGRQALAHRERAVMDQVACIFIPHVTILGVGQTMEFLNSDPIIHNIHTWPRKTPR